jgi:hypothetical protein
MNECPPCHAFLFVAWVGQCLAADFDTILRRGCVVDGTGNPTFFTDVGIRAGLIAAVGNITNSTTRKLDGCGLIVAPRFIDLHTHADEVAENPKAENFLRMGVTTVVVGNCGSWTLNVKKFFSEIEVKPASTNDATLVGHNSGREAAIGGSATGRTWWLRSRHCEEPRGLRRPASQCSRLCLRAREL